MKRKLRLKILVGKMFSYRVDTIFGRLDYWFLKRKVMRLHKFFGKQYHIVPLDNKNKVTIMDNNFRKEYNKSVPKNQRISYFKLMNMALFTTPSSRIMK